MVAEGLHMSVLQKEGRISPVTTRNQHNDQPSRRQLQEAERSQRNQFKRHRDKPTQQTQYYLRLHLHLQCPYIRPKTSCPKQVNAHMTLAPAVTNSHTPPKHVKKSMLNEVREALSAGCHEAVGRVKPPWGLGPPATEINSSVGTAVGGP